MKNIQIQNKAALWSRWYQFQKERFPVLAHGLMIAVFTFSAIGYSRMSRGAVGFVAWSDFLLTVFITFTLFLLLRLFDEVKDYEDDIQFRKYLPLPRGLISMKEMKQMTITVICLQLLVLTIFKPILLPIYAICLGYMLLMRVEFFVPDWLRERQVMYILSHMLIIPLVDIFASATDWKLADVSAPVGLGFFFIVSFLNGLVLEFGRKFRTPKTEEPGVVSYTNLWGLKGGTFAYLGALFFCLISALVAAYFAGHPALIYVLLITAFLVCAIPALVFLNNPTQKMSKIIEHASGVWTLMMYLLLGGGMLVFQVL